MRQSIKMTIEIPLNTSTYGSDFLIVDGLCVKESFNPGYLPTLLKALDDLIAARDDLEPTNNHEVSDDEEIDWDADGRPRTVR